MNRKTYIGLVSLIITLGLASLYSCHHNAPVEQHQEGDIVIHRFDKLLFDTPAATLQQTLRDSAQIYNSQLIRIYPDDMEYMQLMLGFVEDPGIQAIYHTTDSCFKSMAPFEHELTAALKKAGKLIPTIKYDHFYTLVTGIFDYDQRVLCDENSVVISLDQYALPQMEQYAYFGLPQYLVNQSQSKYMVTDCMAAIARQHIARPASDEFSLLDFMVNEGKVLYFLEQVMPGTPDSVKMRYSDTQWKWMTDNEKMVWGYFVQHELLYEKDFNRIHNLVEDAPKTNCFGESAPRTTEYIGWQIVRQYMKRSGATMQELFDNNNTQQILNESGYRP